MQSGAERVVVAADDAAIVDACEAHGVEALLTRTDHASGQRPPGRSLRPARPGRTRTIVVNVQGDEPLIEPALIDAVARTLAAHPDAAMSTAAHAIDSLEDFTNPNVVKAVLDAQRLRALLQPRADPVVARRLRSTGYRGRCRPRRRPLRHIGIYGYRAGFVRAVSRPAAGAHRGHRGAGTAARAVARPPDRGARHFDMRPGPASTRPKTWRACAPCSPRCSPRVRPERPRTRMLSSKELRDCWRRLGGAAGRDTNSKNLPRTP